MAVGQMDIAEEIPRNKLFRGASFLFSNSRAFLRLRRSYEGLNTSCMGNWRRTSTSGECHARPTQRLFWISQNDDPLRDTNTTDWMFVIRMGKRFWCVFSQRGRRQDTVTWKESPGRRPAMQQEMKLACRCETPSLHTVTSRGKFLQFLLWGSGQLRRNAHWDRKLPVWLEAAYPWTFWGAIGQKFMTPTKHTQEWICQ